MYAMSLSETFCILLTSWKGIQWASKVITVCFQCRLVGTLCGAARKQSFYRLSEMHTLGWK